jgi:dTDP-4-dehydrorhamnose 3,5-epimerase
MRLLETPIRGLFLAESAPHVDSRGAFARFYCERDLAAAVGGRRVVQINHSRTESAGAIRGMHFQNPPHAESKLVRCLKGAVHDVVVDLRAGSATFLKWYSRKLVPGGDMMIIPAGFAHGFQVLEPGSELLYLHTEFYAPDAEGGLRHDDPLLAIDWPLPVSDISARDSKHPLIPPDFRGLHV